MMIPTKIKYAFVITIISSFLLICLGVAFPQSKSGSTISELRQAKKEQGLVGRYFQDSTSKKWFLEDREGNSYKFDETTKKWTKIGEPSAPTATPEPKAGPGRPAQSSVIHDKYYVAVKTLKLLQQPERGAREVGLLDFRTKVEKLAENDHGWMQVHQREKNLTGWVFRPRWSLEKYQLEWPRTGGGKKKASQPKEEKPEAKPEPM
jgi:hypothetical protein